MGKVIREEESSLITDKVIKMASLKETYEGWFPTRYVFAILASFGILNVYAMRVNLSVALVAMINNTAIVPPVTDNATHADCSELSGNSTADVQPDGKFIWDEYTQSIILGSFFWGYIVTQLPGGRLAEIYSGKWIFGIGILCTAIFTLLTPIAANTGYWYLVVCRVMEGLGEGVTFPTMHAMISKWSPPNERSRIVTIIFAGSLLGTVLGLPLSGLLVDYGFAGGWPSIFYVFGAFGVVWFILWALFAYDSPEVHPFISIAEKEYIRKSIGCKKYHKSPPVPWKKVLTSMPVWAIVVGHFSHNWGFYTLLTELPTYLKTILHFQTQKNGFMSALPYLAAWVVSLFVSTAGDKLVEHKLMSITHVRKLFQFIGQILPGACMLAVTVTGCNQDWPFVLLVFAVAFSAFTYGGFQCNHIDIAPNYAGTLLGITNTVATIPGWMGPFTVGALTNGKPFRSQWAIVFYIASSIYLCAGIFFVLFASGEEQPWNCLEEKPAIEKYESEDDVDVYVAPKDRAKSK